MPGRFDKTCASGIARFVDRKLKRTALRIAGWVGPVERWSNRDWTRAV
jgi:hypothetical protein